MNTTNEVAPPVAGPEAASDSWNQTFMRQSHIEFAFMMGMALVATFVGSRDDTWRYFLAVAVIFGTTLAYLFIGSKAMRNRGRRGRYVSANTPLAHHIDPLVQRRISLTYLAVIAVAAGIIAWVLPARPMSYFVFLIMGLVDSWHLFSKRRFTLYTFLAVTASILIAIALQTHRVLTREEWLIVAIQFGVSAVGAGAVTFFEMRNIRETEKYVVLVDELRETRAELAASQHEAGVVAERERVAQEIHDTLAQGFLAIVTQAQVAAAAIGRDDTAARERLTIIEQVARENLAEARGLVAATAPVPLRGVGLAAALHNLGRRFAAETAIEITVQSPDDGIAGLSAAQEVVLVRAAQEALNNVRRHSGASAATIRLSSTEAAAVLVVTDNGKGIPPEAAQGYGLTGMRDRVEAIGGAMTISSAGPNSENGTTIRIELPQGTAQ